MAQTPKTTKPCNAGLGLYVGCRSPNALSVTAAVAAATAFATTFTATATATGA